MRLAVLHSRMSGYLAGCLREFRRQSEAQLLIIAKPNQPNAPFDRGVFSDIGEIFDRSSLLPEEIEQRVRAFEPDAILVSGWADPVYNRLNRELKAEGIPVIAGCDTQWTGAWRQRVACLVAPWHVRRFIDVLWVTGNRQRRLAEALGFRGNRCWEGYYACDWEAFAWSVEDGSQRAAVRGQKSEGGSQRSEGRDQKSGLPPPTSDLCSPSSGSSFLFVGRYVAEKGVDVLVKAYARYRDLCEATRDQKAENSGHASDLRPPTSAPWSLVCAGKGELAALLTGEGVQDRGFVQPADLPQLMREASVFVLPSRFEPWGVVVQEAAASGLPLIVSRACGAGDHLLREGQNGFVTVTGNVQALAAAMIQMHRLDEDERRKFGRRSFELSRQYTPERWAKTLHEGIGSLRQRAAGGSQRAGNR